MDRWQDIKDEKEKYAAYLASREWSLKKEAVHERSHGRCERCLANHIDAVHHLTYIRKYNERLEDLQGICNACHEFNHGKSEIDPTKCVWKIPIEKIGKINGIKCPVCGSTNMIPVGCTQIEESEFFTFAFSIKTLCKNDHSFELLLAHVNGGIALLAQNLERIE